jgi:hypothetical protein
MNLSFNQYAKDRGEFFPFDEEERLRKKRLSAWVVNGSIMG